ncbi:hypothetical protein NPIL_215861 [Nephila pilipes]|uniref:Uncharacterized protein n=1 Tax=Nephila pilipes TaxID=299642 RepID=A0A8X6TFW7_NEPPI|nr:hypothetical protein NPIL_215861 [Nephila pilipes]
MYDAIQKRNVKFENHTTIFKKRNKSNFHKHAECIGSSQRYKGRRQSKSVSGQGRLGGCHLLLFDDRSMAPIDFPRVAQRRGNIVATRPTT